MPQYIFLVSFLCATLLLQWWQLPMYPLWIWLVLFEIVIIGRRKRYWMWGSIGIITALTCVARTTHVMSPNSVDWYARGEKIIIEGVIVDEPDRRPLQTKYTVDASSIIEPSGIRHTGIGGRVLVTDHRQWPRFNYGDTVSVHGKLEIPEPIETFQYDKYLSRFNIYSVMYRGSISPNPTPNPLNPNPIRLLYSLKEHFENQINTLYPEPHASFMAGLLTGSRKGIPEDLMQDFNETGLTHIIAISGYNISIIIVVMQSMLFWLPSKMRYATSIISIILFTIFVGASAAVVRASIMGILGITALQAGRKTSARLSVLWAAFFMVAWNPKVMWYDAGFQLSFLAVIGLIEISPLLEPLLKRIPQTLAIRESLTMTLSAQIAATPLIIILFGRLSVISPFANILVAPALPFAMLLGAIGTLVSFVSLPLGLLISYGGWAALEWIIFVANAGAHMPGASINMNISISILLLYYATLFLTIRRVKSSSSPVSMELLPSSKESILEG